MELVLLLFSIVGYVSWEIRILGQYGGDYSFGSHLINLFMKLKLHSIGNTIEFIDLFCTQKRLNDGC
jgi:hypothetical protein